MTALVGMRLAAFVRGGRALAPLVAALVVLTVLYGGGDATAAEAYGVSAVVLFPVLAWQTKLLLDVEPDVQRRLARVAAGARREAAAGVLAAQALGLAASMVAMVLPWLVGGIRAAAPGDGQPSLSAGVGLGVLAHLLATLAAVVVGAMSSRAVTRGAVAGVTALVGGVLLVIVLGLRGSVAPWLVPPVMATARALGAAPDIGDLLRLTGHTLLWCALVLAGYWRLRRYRS